MASEHVSMQWTTPRLLFTGGLYVFWLLVAAAMILLTIDWVLKPSTYPVQSVSFEGPFSHVSQSELEHAVLPGLTGSFLAVDLHAARQRVEGLSWVSRAWVSRRWPNSIHVRFSEQQFVARWRDNAWLNDDGHVITLPKADGPHDLVVLSGPEGSEAQVLATYRRLDSVMQRMHLSIDALALTQRRMWKLRLKNKVELIIGRDRVDERIERFTRIYPFLVRRGKAVRRIDLRYANGLAVARTNGNQTFTRNQLAR